MTEPYFSKDYFKFFRALKKNNTREWFQAHKKDYEDQVKAPLQRFIVDFGPQLEKISPHFVADPRGNGGSMFRIYRDTRFSKDKTPYKTFGAIHFRHEAGKNAHAAGFYLHVAPTEVVFGAGMWQPEADALRAIRERIVEKPKEWQKATGGKAFKEQVGLHGSSLKRAPKGFDPEHPLIEDLKRKDFIAVMHLPPEAALEADFLKTYAKACKTMSPLARFITEACGNPY